MSHLVRLGILFVVAIAGFLYARTMTSVVSVEPLGLPHDDNPRLWAARAVNNQRPDACTECHQGMYDGWNGSAHLGVTCEDCHGSAKEHIAKARNKENALFPLADAKDLCLTCHAMIAGRPPGFPQVDPARHPEALKGSLATCTLCHTPHNPGIPPEFTHSLDGRTVCLNCHGADKWKPVPPDHAKRTQETCLTCHRQKETK